jgi:3-oxoadipate enol-lactonase
LPQHKLGLMTQIVWIHGFPLTSQIFEKQRSIRATHVMPDLPGFGSAPPPKGAFTMDDYARYILDSFEGKAVLAGLSMGGYILFAAARIAPERIEGAILIDTRETPDAPEAKKGRYETVEKVKEKGVTVVVDAMLPKMVVTPQLKDPVRAIMMSSSAAGVIAALRAMAERPDSTETLRNMKVPILAIAGSEDTITPPSDARRMSKSAVIIQGAAHLSNYEKPEMFNQAVETFLQRP